MNSEFLLVPKERIAVIIGRGGETKKSLEKKGNCSLQIDSFSGEIEVIQKSEDGLNFYQTVSAVKAIARGFSPEHAFKLFENDNSLEIIDLTEFIGKNSKALEQKRGRVIGAKGKIREEIEKETHSLISVFGKTISIIGEPENIEKAKKAVELLLKGSTHETVEKFLTKKQTEKFEL